MPELMLGDPVHAGQPGVEHAVGDVACHFLRADQHALDLGIVNGRKIRPCADENVESGALEQLHRRRFERALGNAEPQLHRGTSGEKHERAPVWQTWPSPSRCALISTVSSSQSTNTLLHGKPVA